MFWDNFVTLCNQKGKSPNGVCAELGFSANTATKWKQGSIPRDTTLRKIADYFGVSVSYLVGAIDTPDPIALINPEKKEPPLLPLVQELGQQLEALAALGGLVDQLTDEQVEELRKYAEFLASKNKK